MEDCVRYSNSCWLLLSPRRIVAVGCFCSVYATANATSGVPVRMSVLPWPACLAWEVSLFYLSGKQTAGHLPGSLPG